MSTKRSIFISWSGDIGRCVAEALHSWLPFIVESPQYWIASRDAQDGGRWIIELTKRLESSHFGIIVVTPENISSSWQMFEAGALSKNTEQSIIVPYLVALDKKSLSGPLSQFQALIANKEHTGLLS